MHVGPQSALDAAIEPVVWRLRLHQKRQIRNCKKKLRIQPHFSLIMPSGVGRYLGDRSRLSAPDGLLTRANDAYQNPHLNFVDADRTDL